MKAEEIINFMNKMNNIILDSFEYEYGGKKVSRKEFFAKMKELDERRKDKNLQEKINQAMIDALPKVIEERKYPKEKLL